MSERYPTNDDKQGRAEHLFASRNVHSRQPGEAVEPESMPDGIYEPNEPQQATQTAASFPTYDDYLPNEPEPSSYAPPPEVEANFSAYYRRDGGAEELPAAEPAFAPPPKLDLFGSYADAWHPEEAEQPALPQSNVYRPREVTWADTERRNVAVSADGGYQVQEEHKGSHRRRRHVLRAVIGTLVVLALIGGSAYLLRDQLTPLVNQLLGHSAIGTEAPFEALVTPAPIKGYDAAPAVQVAPQARSAISEISGTVNMETYTVTDANVLTRNLRSDGSYDFYLFTGEDGKLLGYYEGLGARDMVPLADGNFYVKQPPYLINRKGSALIRLDELQKVMGERLVLHQLLGGWAIVENEAGTMRNYIDPSGHLLSQLWFSRAFPFTGGSTIGYVDTGSLTDLENRYLLYVLDANGNMVRWTSAASTAGVVGSACNAAYMNDGKLYSLADIEAPLAITDQVSMYLDCDAMVVRDSQSGKYALYVHGERHYDFEYDSIVPVECEVQWAKRSASGAGGTLELYAVTEAAYPQPLSHYFVLMKDGKAEYVALSTDSAYPILLDDLL
ncbi:MAG: hypothetical protein RSG96_01115 [Clostridia bacterium]